MKNFFKLLWALIVEFFKTKDQIELPEEKPTPEPNPIPVQGAWVALIKLYAQMPNIKDHHKIASMAQFILESGRGTSDLCKKHLNFAGLKWRPEMGGYAHPVNIKVPSEDRVEQFCGFNTLHDFIMGYWRFIERDPYKGWNSTETAGDYIDHLFLAGYAVDPNYPKKVKSLFKEARRLLEAAGAELEDPPRPSNPVGHKNYEIPEMKELPVDFDNHGFYKTPTGNASGLVVHYTVSGRTAKNTLGVARYMASKGLGCLLMDEDGIIYYPRNWSHNLWQKRRDDHAGRSAWKGKTSVSRYFMGIEICNWGSAAPEKGVKDVRRIPSQKDNQKPGTYQKYTARQEKSLINFILWQLDVNPEFKLENVVGHDEVAPTRKSDPGGSLSMSMLEFRAYLRGMV